MEVLRFRLSGGCSSYRNSASWWDYGYSPGLWRYHHDLGRAAVDSCAVCALHKVLGQGGKKELELCTQPGPLGGSAQGGEGRLSVISTEVPYSLAVTLGLGKEKRESGKDNLYRGVSFLHRHSFRCLCRDPGKLAPVLCVSWAREL